MEYKEINDYERVISVEFDWEALLNWTSSSSITRRDMNRLKKALRKYLNLPNKIRAIINIKLEDSSINDKDIALELGVSRTTLYKRYKTIRESYPEFTSYIE